MKYVPCRMASLAPLRKAGAWPNTWRGKPPATAIPARPAPFRNRRRLTREVIRVLACDIVTPPCGSGRLGAAADDRSEEHTSELQSQSNLACRLLLHIKQ